MGRKSLSLLLHSSGVVLNTCPWCRSAVLPRRGEPTNSTEDTACPWPALLWFRRHFHGHPQTLKLLPTPWTRLLGTDSLKDLIRSHLIAAIHKHFSVLPTYLPLALQICSQTCTEWQKNLHPFESRATCSGKFWLLGLQWLKILCTTSRTTLIILLTHFETIEPGKKER